jgi:hypothetical protein
LIVWSVVLPQAVAYAQIAGLLAELSPLVTNLELDIDHQFLRHRLIRLEGTSEFLTIDFVVQAHS